MPVRRGSYDDREKEIELEAGGIVVATGFEFLVSIRDFRQYGYDR